MGMIEKAEAECRELIKREVVEADRAKIESVIAELDEKKNATLQATWVKVNRDFGSISDAAARHERHARRPRARRTARSTGSR